MPNNNCNNYNNSSTHTNLQKKRKENLSYLRAAKLRIMAVNQTASAFTAFNVFCHAHCPLQKNNYNNNNHVSYKIKKTQLLKLNTITLNAIPKRK